MRAFDDTGVLSDLLLKTMDAVKQKMQRELSTARQASSHSHGVMMEMQEKLQAEADAAKKLAQDEVKLMAAELEEARLEIENANAETVRARAEAAGAANGKIEMLQQALSRVTQDRTAAEEVRSTLRRKGMACGHRRHRL